MERFLLWPLIHNMLNGWLCHVTCTLLVILAFPINPWLTQLWYWPCLPFTSDFAYSVTCWHSPPISCLCHWEKICTFWSYGKSGTFKTSSSPRQFWGTLSLVVNLSLCGMPGGVLGADHWSLLSLTLAERRRRRQRKRRAVENEPDKGPETDPSHSAEPGEYAASLSAPLISQRQPLWQCDTDYWKPWFRLSLLCVAANSVS